MEEELKQKAAAEGLMDLKYVVTDKDLENIKERIKIVDLRMKELAQLTHGEELIKMWTKNGRKIYESIAPTLQCNFTINKPEKCWICGFGFDNTTKAVCEHVLPIAQAVFYLGLYGTREKLNDKNTISKIYKLEYEWAHNYCNLLKSDMVLINETIDKRYKTPIWNPDTDKITSLLKKIQSSPNPNFIKIQRQIAADPNWLQNRIVSMTNRVKQITDYISRPPEEPGFGNLVILAGWAAMKDPENINKKFLEFLNIDTTSQYSSRKRQRTAGRKRKNKRTRKNGFKIYK
jgi:hypothetical protein